MLAAASLDSWRSTVWVSSATTKVILGGIRALMAQWLRCCYGVWEHFTRVVSSGQIYWVFGAIRRPFTPLPRLGISRYDNIQSITWGLFFCLYWKDEILCFSYLGSDYSCDAVFPVNLPFSSHNVSLTRSYIERPTYDGRDVESASLTNNARLIK